MTLDTALPGVRDILRALLVFLWRLILSWCTYDDTGRGRGGRERGGAGGSVGPLNYCNSSFLGALCRVLSSFNCFLVFRGDVGGEGGGGFDYMRWRFLHLATCATSSTAVAR